MQDRAANRFRLCRFDNLVHVGQIDRGVPENNLPRRCSLDPELTVFVMGIESVSQRNALPRAFERATALARPSRGKTGGNGMGLTGDVARCKFDHLNHAIGDAEIVTRSTHHQDGGNVVFFVENSHPIDERSYRLVFLCDQFLHSLIANHEIGGAGVLVHQEHFGAGFDGLGDEGRLGCAAAGIFS